ncbi:GNAT family N-acetyltransferase [Streptomyces tateyamensis]|uniref:GNAT family N-acetyltransferase n=1 Tax=Streptomyces tateyamensis TaxID=565073 RepID=A0A2V4MTT2_9ACTN|nr:GNAT family N-acetyltransferase [Streptomyces tateyamensis]PYC67845.1 GNAT family N-acetyltransferase [Streptomyces tateyamensis]
MGTHEWTVTPVPVEHPEAVAVVREYLAEIVARYYGRPVSAAELDQVVLDEPLTGLETFLIARQEDRVAGCAGLRRLDAVTGEVTKVYVHPAARGQGGGARLLAAVEAAAGERGMAVLRLDTRGDLVEARALYARAGYREIPRYNDSPYAAHWFEKELPGTAPVRPPTAS